MPGIGTDMSVAVAACLARPSLPWAVPWLSYPAEAQNAQWCSAAKSVCT
jgi:hypothetical protein